MPSPNDAGLLGHTPGALLWPQPSGGTLNVCFTQSSNENLLHLLQHTYIIPQNFTQYCCCPRRISRFLMSQGLKASPSPPDEHNRHTMLLQLYRFRFAQRGIATRFRIPHGGQAHMWLEETVGQQRHHFAMQHLYRNIHRAKLIGRLYRSMPRSRLMCVPYGC